MPERNRFEFERVITNARVVESASVYAESEDEARKVLVESPFLYQFEEWTVLDGNTVGPPSLTFSEEFLPARNQ